MRRPLVLRAWGLKQPGKMTLEWMRKNAQKGGKVTGSCKRRGDSEHYRKMAIKRWGKPSLTELLEKSVELEKQKRSKA